MTKISSAMHIALMLPQFSRYGGVEQFGYRLSVALAERGHKVTFICARQEEPAPKGVTVKRVKRFGGLKVLKLLWFVFKAEQERKKNRYDLSISLGKNWNQDLSRMGGGPLRIFWQQSEKAYEKGLSRLWKQVQRRLSPSNWLVLFIEKHQFHKQSQVIAVSHLVRQWLLEGYPALDPDKVTVIYNKPDSSRFFPVAGAERERARQRLLQVAGCHAPLAGPAVLPSLYIGTATTNFLLKGIGPLIKAVALLPDHVHLFIAGGRRSKRYEKLAATLGIESRIHFCGKVKEMPAFYQGLDLFVLNTFYDACSNAVLEGLATGIPVFSTSSNGASHFLPLQNIIPDPSDFSDIAKRVSRAFEERKPVTAFSWPESEPAGIEAFVAQVEKMAQMKKFTTICC